MNIRQLLFWAVGAAAGAFFVWLALQGIDLDRLGDYLGTMEKGWILPFAVTAFAANVLRGLRWRLLFQNPARISRRTIVAATLAGYAANVAVPRLGEVSRCGYMAKNSDATMGEALATVVIERTVDVLSLLLLMIATMVFVVTDPVMIESLIGVPATQVYRILAGVLAVVVTGAAAVWLLHRNKERFDRLMHALIEKLPVLEKFIRLGQHMLEGLTAVKHLRSWPLFSVYTAGIWALYVAMSWIPFSAINDPALNALGATDAFDVMVISSLGVVIPSPSGVGTYHFFTQKALHLLHQVPGEVAMAYAVVTHAVMILAILITALITVLSDRLLLKKP